MANKENNLAISLNNSITTTSRITNIFQYFRWSKYGRLVIIDIGGITISAGGQGQIASGLPIARTRPVFYGMYDLGPLNNAECICMPLNGTTIHCNKGNDSYRIFGQGVYFTD